MTTDLEKQFFKTFGIEPKEKFYCLKGYCNQNPSVKTDSPKCRECENGNYYTCPEITDRILLELICLITKELNYFTNFSTNYEHLKEYILKEMILHKDDFSKSQVQELFKE